MCAVDRRLQCVAVDVTAGACGQDKAPPAPHLHGTRLYADWHVALGAGVAMNITAIYTASGHMGSMKRAMFAMVLACKWRLLQEGPG